MIVYQNNTATANFTATINWVGGWGALYVGGTLGSGTVSLTANDGAGTARSTFVALGASTTTTTTTWAGFWAPAGAVIKISLTGATNPAAAVTVFTQN